MTVTVNGNDVMRAWVGCLACYSEGRLVGEWVDAVDAAECVPCQRAGHEEWWVMDHEGLPVAGECSPGEATRWAEIMTACAEGTGAPLDAVRAYLDNFHGYEDALNDFEDAWCGEWESERQYAEEYAEECGYLSTPAEHAHHWGGQAVPNPLLDYVDWDAWARDLFTDGYWSARNPAGGVFVFRAV